VNGHQLKGAGVRKGTAIGGLSQSTVDAGLESHALTGCGHCTWIYEGTEAEGHRAFLRHRAEAHPRRESS
jgi:hypothetical protein